MECPCARAGAVCHLQQSCVCVECDNPLNILHVLGLDVHAARVDECLMQNLYSYNVSHVDFCVDLSLYILGNTDFL